MKVSVDGSDIGTYIRFTQFVVQGVIGHVELFRDLLSVLVKNDVSCNPILQSRQPAQPVPLRLHSTGDWIHPQEVLFELSGKHLLCVCAEQRHVLFPLA